MASLENASIASSYTSLLKLSGNTDNLVAGASGDAIQIVDGNGTGSSLYLNTDRIGVGIVPLAIFQAKTASNVNFTLSANSDDLRINAVNDATDTAIGLEFNGADYEFLGTGTSTFGGNVTTSKANATGNSIILQQSLGSIASPSTSADTNILGKIQFVGKSTNDTPVGAEIKSVVTGTVGSAKNMPSSLVFSTQPVGGADLTTALTLAADRSATFAGEVIAHSGVNFPDDASTNPSSDVNTLDSYEEGDWTPTLTTNGTDFGSVTYDSLTGGRYTKIGNVVHFQGFLRTDAVTVGSASNDTAIGGLPFTAIASNGGKVDGQSAMNIGTVSGWAGENPSHGMVMGNTSIIQLYYMDYNVDAVNIASGSDVTAGTSADKNAIYFSGTYISS